MTFREKLADWISGGALYRSLQELELESIWRRDMERRRLNTSDLNVRLACDLRELRLAMKCIKDEVANGKSGTAQKIHRMAKEALGE